MKNRFFAIVGTKRWHSDTRKLHAIMESARLPIALESYDSHELEELPAPVQSYFRTVLREGLPLIATVDMEHTGSGSLAGSLLGI